MYTYLKSIKYYCTEQRLYFHKFKKKIPLLLNAVMYCLLQLLRIYNKPVYSQRTASEFCARGIFLSKLF